MNTRPKNKLEKTLVDFFNAENDRNWELYKTFLSPDVEWIMYGPPRRKVVAGREEYVDTMIKVYRDIEARFDVLNMVSDLERGIVITELQLLSRRSVDIFEFEKGLIKREREYYDDNVWTGSEG